MTQEKKMTNIAPTPNMIRPRKVAPVEQPKVGNAKSRRKTKRAAEQASKVEHLTQIHEARVDNHRDPNWREPLTHRPFVGLDGLMARATKE